jgi:hypothetical protein
MYQAKLVQKIKTHFTSIPFPENHAVYETMCKNMVQSERPQMTI